MIVSPYIKNENSILLEEMLVYRLFLHMEAHMVQSWEAFVRNG